LASAILETELSGGIKLRTPVGATSLTDFDLRLLRVFKTIVEEGGLKSAQAALDVSLPTISKHLADLESRFGVRLCQRGPRKFELTSQGKIIYKAAVELFSGIDQFQRETDQVRRGQRGELRIGIMDNMISDPNCPLIGALRTLKAADLHVRLAVLDPDTVQQRIQDGRLDVGIVPPFKQWPGLEYKTLYAERLYLYCGATHPLYAHGGEPSRSELANYPFVEHGYVDGREVEGFPAPAKTGATAWQVEAVAFLVMSGNFLGHLPAHYADPLEQQGRLRKVHSKAAYDSSVAAVFKAGVQQSRALRRFLAALQVTPSPNRARTRGGHYAGAALEPTVGSRPL
jgi:LysR family transcriptional regulator, transcriptional activator for bauABCD operon